MSQISLLNVYLNDLVLFLGESASFSPALENRQMSICLNADATVLFSQHQSGLHRQWPSNLITLSVNSKPKSSVLAEGLQHLIGQLLKALQRRSTR